MTMNQLMKGKRVDRHVLETKRRKKSLKNLSKVIKSAPLISGIVEKVLCNKPKKPNSAQRKICKVILSNGRNLTVYIPGQEGLKACTPNSKILFFKRNKKDLPGVRYVAARGLLDCKPDTTKKNGRSKYGVKRN